MLDTFQHGKKTKETDIKPKKVNASGSLPRKQNKNTSQNNKKFLKNIAAIGFSKLRKWYLQPIQLFE